MWHLWSLPIKSLFCLYYILGFCYLQLKDSSILHVRRTHHISIHIRKWKHSVLNAKFRCQEWTLEVRGCSSLYSCVAGDLGNWTLKPLLSLYMYVKAVGWLCGIGEGKIYRNQLLGGFWVEQLLLVPLLCFLRPPLISAKSIRASWLPLVGLLSPSFPTNVPFTLAAVPAVVYVTPSALSMNIVYLHGCLIVSEIPVVVPIRETEELVVIHYQQLKTVPVPYLWFNTSSSSNSLVVFEWYARPCNSPLLLSPFLVTTPSSWNHLRFSTHVLSWACVSLLRLFLESPSLLALHIEFSFIISASPQILSPLGSLPKMSCSLLPSVKTSVCILLAAPWCPLSCYCSLYIFLSHAADFMLLKDLGLILVFPDVLQ